MGVEKMVLSEDNIILGASYPDKWEAIRACGKILLEQGYIREEYIEDMMERERLDSVYVGNHIAIPHGIANSEKNILHSGISVIQLAEGVDFGEEKAYLMFGIAGKDGTHIDLLSKIAVACMEESNIQKMRKARNKKEIIEILNCEL